MAAPEGNQYNKIWTKKEREKLYNECVKALKEHKFYSLNQVIFYLQDNYSKHFKGKIYVHLFDYLFKTYEDFSLLKKEIEKQVENNVFMAGLNDEKNHVMAIAYLNTYHGWKERKDYTSGDEKFTPDIKVFVTNPKK